MVRDGLAYPDTCVGTDSHTTMVNGIGVVGWGVGGIEAEAAMLGQPVSMLIPRVVGFKLSGSLPEGSTATDLVLTITEMVRKHGVVGKFVEFYGPGVSALPLANRATIGNMSPEFGSTIAVFPIDDETIKYLKLTGRSEEQLALVESYAKTQGLWHDPSAEPRYSEKLELDLSTVVPSLAGPKRPQDRVELSNAAAAFAGDLPTYSSNVDAKVPVTLADGTSFELENGAVTIASITSCTNTSNPSVLIAAGLLAKNAVAKGLTTKPWVKTSLAPGSQVVTDYLEKAGLQVELDKLGFNLVGYGCTTCIGNSGPLSDEIIAAVEAKDLVVAAVLSGNRNFEGRVSPQTKANYLASPPLVVAYALAGSMKVDLTKDALGTGKDGKPVYLRDIWPSNQDIAEEMNRSLTPEMFRKRYANVFEGPAEWRKVKTTTGLTYKWSPGSTYVKNPPYFENMPKEPGKLTDVRKARILGLLGDSITTEHIDRKSTRLNSSHVSESRMPSSA